MTYVHTRIFIIQHCPKFSNYLITHLFTLYYYSVYLSFRQNEEKGVFLIRDGGYASSIVEKHRGAESLGRCPFFFFANESKMARSLTSDLLPIFFSLSFFLSSSPSTFPLPPSPPPFILLPGARTIRLNYRGAQGVKWVSSRGLETTRNGGRTAFRGLHSDDGF